MTRHIWTFCLIYLRPDVPSLTEIEYLQIKPSKREHIPMKVWCLKFFICANSSDEKSGLDGLICSFISFLSLQLNEFLQSEIEQKLSSIQKFTCVTAIANKKITRVFSVSGLLYSLPQSAVEIKVSLAWLYFLLESTTED